MFEKIESFMNRFTARQETKPVRDQRTQEVLDKSEDAREHSRKAIEAAYEQAGFAFAHTRKKGH